MELSSGVRLLRDHWLLILSFIIAAMAISGVVTWRQTPQYSSKVTFFVSALADRDDAASAYQGSLLSQQKVKSYAELLRTQRVMGGVIDRLRLKETPQQLSAKVATAVVPDTSLLTATVTNPSPAAAQRIARALGNEFVELVPSLESTSGSSQTAVKVSVVSKPRLPVAPTTPKPIRNLSIAAVIGLFAGLACAVARRALDTTVKTSEQLEKIVGEPTIGTVAIDRKMAKSPLIVHDPQGVRAEEIRKIRTNLQFVDVDRPHKVILVTSAVAGEGKSTTACNLVIALAQAGKKVILVDADLRQPKATHYLGVPNGVGLTDVLVGNVELDVATQSWGKQLFAVLASGSTPPNPSELLGSQQMRDLLSKLRDTYDVVVLDAPPLLPVTDAAVTAAACDGVLLIVRRGKTRQEQLRTATNTLNKIEAPVLGIVLNFAASSSYKPYKYGNARIVQESKEEAGAH